MRQSTLFGRTLRDAPAEAQSASHQLVLRAALARPLASGIYTLLPLGFRVARRIEQVIREEMDRIGAQEMRVPIVTPAELWQETGRWDALEPHAFRTRDHGGRDYMIPYTHEELFMHHARQEIMSYRQLPLIAYHFQAKGRDEERSRGGLLRVREFVMKDAYSFDADHDAMERSYQATFEAYQRMFRRLGLDAHAVESDTGAMGGDVAHEFQVLTDEGEDTLVFCGACDYKANLERATRRIPIADPVTAAVAASPIETPGITTIEQLEATLGLPATAFLKTLVLRTPQGIVAAVLPGDRELNHAKLRKLLGASRVDFAGDAELSAAGGVPGYVSPVGLNARVVVDMSVEPRGYVAGANQKDRHVRDVLVERDFAGERADIHDVRDGDACPRCGGALGSRRGIEVGNIFKFGTYYSDKMNATYLAEDGARKPLYFASYGIGVGRSLQTIVIAHHDDRGIVWPFAVAPFEAHVIALPMSDENVRSAAETLVATLEANGVEVLFDDRPDAAGAKFADADLIGIPFRVTVSRRGLSGGTVELKRRDAAELEIVPAADAAATVTERVRLERERAR